MMEVKDLKKIINNELFRGKGFTIKKLNNNNTFSTIWINMKWQSEYYRTYLEINGSGFKLKKSEKHESYKYINLSKHKWYAPSQHEDTTIYKSSHFESMEQMFDELIIFKEIILPRYL